MKNLSKSMAVNTLVVFLLFSVLSLSKGQSVTFYPPDSTYNVATSSELYIHFSDSVYNTNGTELTNTNVDRVLSFLKGGPDGTPVSFTATINEKKDSIYISLTDGELDESSEYYFALESSVMSGSGPISPESIIFFTEDKTPPTINYTPADQTTGISDTTHITVAFNETIRLIDNSEINNSNVQSIFELKSIDENVVSFDVVINETIDTFIINPTSNLTSETTYLLIVSGIEDMSDNAADNDTLTFTIADVLGPVPTHYPANGQSNIPVNASLYIKFDEAIQGFDNSFLTSSNIDDLIILRKNDINGADVEFDATINNNKDSISVNPYSNLISEGVYYFGFADSIFKDGNNNLVLDSFVTFTAEDIGPVLSFNPENGSTDFHPGSTITIAFSKPVLNTDGSNIDSSDIQNLVVLRENDQDGSDIYFTGSINDSRDTIFIDPNEKLIDFQKYYLSVSSNIQDDNGLSISSQYITFTTEDGTVPGVSFYPADASGDIKVDTSFYINFNEPVRQIDDSDITDPDLSSLIMLTKDSINGESISYSATINAEKTEITITPDLWLKGYTNYYLAIQPVEDDNNNATVSESISFRTEVLGATTVFDPNNNETGVDTSANITIEFSEPVLFKGGVDIDNTNIDSVITFKQTDENGQDWGFDATINVEDSIITIDPDSSLYSETDYYVAIGSDFYNTNEEINEDKSIIFTTADVISPTYSFNLNDGETNVFWNQDVVIEFNEPIRDTGDAEFNAGNIADIITFKRTSDEAALIFTADINEDKTIVTVTPSASILELTEYRVIVLDGAEDDANNPIAIDSVTYTTGTKPKLIEVDPLDGGKLDSLWQAIDSAAYNDTILIAPGTYDENLQINKPLYLVSHQYYYNNGSDNTILVSTQGSENIIDINDVTSEYMKIDGIIIDGQDTKRGIWLSNSTLTMDSTVIRKAYCTGSGGGIYSTNSNLTITNSIFNNNQTEMGGAGIDADNSEATIEFTKIYENRVLSNANGAGLRVQNSKVTVISSLFYSNVSELGFGGAICLEGSTPDLTVIQSTIVKNSANDNAGGIHYWGNKNSQATIINSIVSGNLNANGNWEYNLSNHTGINQFNIQYSLIGNGQEYDGNWYGKANPWPGEGNVGGDAKFADTSANDFTLSDKSLALGAADETIDNLPSYDITGAARIQGGTSPDMGAFESALFKANLIYKDVKTDLPVLNRGSNAWGDYDNDGDYDLTMSGHMNGSSWIKVFDNDGGTFSEIASFEDKYTDNDAWIEWIDYNLDGHLDLFERSHASKLYKNNGDGSFTKARNINSPGGDKKNSHKWGDFDLDGDIDLFMFADCWQPFILENNNGNFTERHLNDMFNFDWFASADVADIDNDGKPDLLLSGKGCGSNDYSLKIYKNNGSFNFSPVNIVTQSTEINYSVFVDFDSDGDLDIFISIGDENDNQLSIAKIYKNDGGSYSQIDIGIDSIPQFENYSEFEWADMDNDGYLDLVTFAYDDAPNHFSFKLFKNNGNETFTDIETDIELFQHEIRDVACADYDNDGVKEIILTGRNEWGGDITKVYDNLTFSTNTSPSVPGNLANTPNNGTYTLTWDMATDTETPDNAITYNVRIGTSPGGSEILHANALSDGTLLKPENGNNSTYTSFIFRPIAGLTYYWSVQAIDAQLGHSAFAAEASFTTPGPATYLSKFDFGNLKAKSASWGDYDKDGDLDIVMVSSFYEINIFLNYTDSIDVNNPVIVNSSIDNPEYIKWVDYDVDGDLDLYVIDIHENIKLLRNDAGSFTKLNANLGNSRLASGTKWMDYDFDGDLDLVVAKWDWIRVFINNGDDTFSENNIYSFGPIDMQRVSVDVNDYDNDGDNDFVVSGIYWHHEIWVNDYMTRVIENNNGFYNEVTLAGVKSGLNSKWIDYDLDNDLDLLVIGVLNSNEDSSYSILYQNDGGVYSESGFQFDGLNGSVSDIHFEDYDNDGDLDLIYWASANDEGEWYNDVTSEDEKFVIYYYENNITSFTKYNIGLHDTRTRAIDFGDYDADGDLDILLASRNGLKLYNNGIDGGNNNPGVPSGLNTNIEGSNVTLIWDPAADTEDASGQLVSYNIYVGTQENVADIITPISNLSNGALLKPQSGVIKDTSISIELEGGRTYYWSVQAVDAIYATSAFATSGSFQIEGTYFTDIGTDYEGFRNPDLRGSMKLGDIDNDSDLDIIQYGSHQTYNKSISFLINNGDSTFTEEDHSSEFSSLSYNDHDLYAAEWVDIDMDNDLDISLVHNNRLKIYLSDAGMFNEQDQMIYNHVSKETFEWADIDQDGDKDFILHDGDLFALLNDGSGNFNYRTLVGWDHETQSHLFDNFDNNRSGILLFDVNNDGITEIVTLSLIHNEYKFIVLEKIAGLDYNNAIQQIDLGFEATYVTPKYFDYDNDNDLDVIAVFSENDWSRSGKVLLFTNDGGTFTNTELDMGIYNQFGEIETADFDNDGDLDMAIAVGRTENNERIFSVNIYLNTEGNFQFLKSSVDNIEFRDNPPSLALGDLNNDNKADVAITGYTRNHNRVMKVFLNNAAIANTDPTLPDNLTSDISGSNVSLSWDSSTDADTSGLTLAQSEIITYNLRIGSSPGASDILSSSTNPDGSLLLPGAGNYTSTSYDLILPSGKTYYWAVQAVDVAGKGSAFAAEESFTIDGPSFELSQVKDSVYSYYALWADIDNDADLDIAINNDRVIQAYINDGLDNYQLEELSIDDKNNDIQEFMFIDYDNDNDLDIYASRNQNHKLYSNNGAGFTYQPVNLGWAEQDRLGKWIYFDNDGKRDFVTIDGDGLRIGNISGDQLRTQYIWLGNNPYGLVPEFADIDNDDDYDLTISGCRWSHEDQDYLTYLFVFRNDEFDGYTNITGDKPSSYITKWLDFDLDGDMDLFSIGQDSSILYNNTDGNLTPYITNFSGFEGNPGNFEWSNQCKRFGILNTDIDNNGTIDLIYWTPDNIYFYIYNGISYDNYMPVVGNTNIRNLDIADYNNDGDVDLLVNAGGMVKIYENQIAAVNNPPTVPALVTPEFEGSVVTIAWNKATDSESDDASITYNLKIGSTSGGSDILSAQALSNGYLLSQEPGNLGTDTSRTILVKAGTKIYYSIQAMDPNFTTSTFSGEDSLVVPGSPFSPVAVSFNQDLLQNISWGDYDEDDDLDILSLSRELDSANVDMFGNMPEINKVRIYLNDGTGNLSKTDTASFVSEGGMNINSTYWLDYDGDNDLDIFVKSDGRDRLYRNEDSLYNRIDGFITNDNWHFNSNDISFGDFDNDGDLDIIYKKNEKVVLLRNIDDIRYDEVQVDLTQVIKDSEFYYVNLYNSVAEFGDYDNDGDFDILVAGDGEYYKHETNEWVNVKYVNLLNNNGKGVFNKVETDITGEDVKKIEWIDFDNDGDLDVFLRFAERDYYDPAMGEDKTYKLYKNNGNNVFENLIIDFQGVANINDAAWGDFDNDGDLDLAIRGQYRYNEWDVRYKISLYMNEGDGTFSYTFTDVDELSFVHGSSSMAWGDYDNDSDLDLIVSGRADYDNSVVTKIFMNESTVTNNPPTIPGNLKASNDGYILNFEWDASSDSESSTEGLTYNLRVGTTSGGSDIFSAHVTPGGKLLKPGKGNVEHNTSFSLNTFSLADHYYWTVQAVDAGHATSGFATIEAFTPVEPFIERTDIDLVEVKNSASAWGDYDNDGDLDLLITGSSKSGYVANLYRNDTGTFVNTSTILEKMASGDVAWGDYDNDGDLDLIMSGSNILNQPFTKIYDNEGAGVLSESDNDTNIIQVYFSSLAWGDYDDDGDLDLAIAGYSIDWRQDILFLYRNENNNFIREKGFWFEGFENGSMEWADMDNDGDIDLVYAGMNNELQPTGGIIFNSKTGGHHEWHEYFNQGFSVKNSIFDLGDYDNDGDLDIVISGEMDNGLPSTYIMKNKAINRYRDDYYGDFQIAQLDSVMNSSLAWGDYDNDGDLDLLLAGERMDATVVTKLYNNMGNELFVDIGLDLLEGVKDGFVAWGDVENDGDLDLLLTGSTGVGYTSKFIESNMGNATNNKPVAPTNLSFAHDGYGKVTLTWDRASDTETPMDALSYNLRIGTTSGGKELSVTHADELGVKLLPEIGKANSNTWEVSLEPGNYFWSIQSIDGNKTGSAFSSEGVINLDYEWMNLNMKGIVDHSIPGETEGELEWADYDEDGDLDLAIIGNNDSKIYRNDTYYFREVWGGGKYGKGDLAWGDYDNDGDLDLAIAGDQANRSPRTFILRNDDGHFSEDNWEFIYMNFGGFEGIYDGNISWVDFDNDGDLDFVVAGLNVVNQSILRMYQFERDTNDPQYINIYELATDLVPVGNGAFTFGDFDNDEDLDLALMGYSGAVGLITKIYQNEDNNFSEFDVDLPGVENGAIEFADYDNDGDLDIFLAGDGESSTITTILENNYPELTFTNIQPALNSVNDCNVSWGDYDADGDLDLVYSGRSPGLGGITKIYKNDSTGFVDLNFDLSDFNDANMSWGDYDGDEDLDLVITGQASSGEGSLFKVFKNVLPFEDTANLKSYNPKAVKRPRNKPPDVPSKLKTEEGDESTNIRFSWEASADDNTDSPGLTYALRIGTTPGGSEIMSANASGDGTRTLTGKGNVEHNLSWNVNLEPGIYYWAVQAIDASFSGSDFSEEQLLVVAETGITENYAPSDMELTNYNIPEDSPIGTFVANIMATDDNSNEEFSFAFIDSIGGEDNSAFLISGDEIFTQENFDINTKSTYNVLIQVSDRGGLTYRESFTFNIDTSISVINYAPNDIHLDNSYVYEFSPLRTTVGHLSAEDFNKDDWHWYELAEHCCDNHQFLIEGEELKTANVFNYQVQDSYLVGIEAFDQDTASTYKEFTIYVIPLTDIDDTEMDHNVISIYPNPLTDKAVISFNYIEGKTYQYRLINSRGDVVNYNPEIQSSTINISKTDLPVGIYVVQIIDEDGHIAGKKLIVL